MTLLVTGATASSPLILSSSCALRRFGGAGRSCAASSGAPLHIDMPLGGTYRSPGFGMLTNRFGCPWMIGLGA